MSVPVVVMDKESGPQQGNEQTYRNDDISTQSTAVAPEIAGTRFLGQARRTRMARFQVGSLSPVVLWER